MRFKAAIVLEYTVATENTLGVRSQWLRPSEPADICNAPVAGLEGNFPTTPSTCPTIHKIPATTIPSADISKAAGAQQPFTLSTTNPATKAEIGADVDINTDLGFGFRRYT
jgi:hypothetical protein